MSTAKKIILGFVLLVIVLVVAGVLVVRLRPLEVAAWFSRVTLTRSALERQTVETSIGRQTVWVGGAGPPLVFLHGASDQAGTWAQVAPAFAGEYHVLVLDLPGHGDSEPAAGPLTLGIVLKGIEAVLEKKTGQPVILVGNSLGAWVAMLYARAHPLKVARVVAVNGGALRNEPEGLTMTPANRDEARRLVNALRDPSSPPVPDWVLDDVIRQARQGPLARLAASYAEMETHLLDGHVREVAVPVDLLWGESDHLLPVEYAERMREELPGARLTHIPKCGHVPQVECPQRFLGALREVLQQPPPALRPSADVPDQ